MSSAEVKCFFLFQLKITSLFFIFPNIWAEFKNLRICGCFWALKIGIQYLISEFQYLISEFSANFFPPNPLSKESQGGAPEQTH